MGVPVARRGADLAVAALEAEVELALQMSEALAPAGASGFAPAQKDVHIAPWIVDAGALAGTLAGMSTDTIWPPATTEARVAYISARCDAAHVVRPTFDIDHASDLTWDARNRRATLRFVDDPMILTLQDLRPLTMMLPAFESLPWEALAIDMAIMRVSRWLDDGDPSPR